ncbi:hypothetical protein DFA_11897 [Cavenderia fasciculata]|uniref:RRM domain-containing protein n=1 Tax=Cavenderia fasciculata TaxID=261658 RepID=F4QEM0_CACFS|nr:uncharacterized protein DFA_11897 [Cavenderia fasciculata]EGG14131.1 hypothetical protein DFA_11897 [Cavenderia fasciculata]|eukprot:XP_004350839.1 hypothetical protein DFA_11897 [Cavenderia fasciculata]
MVFKVSQSLGILIQNGLTPLKETVFILSLQCLPISVQNTNSKNYRYYKSDKPTLIMMDECQKCFELVKPKEELIVFSKMLMHIDFNPNIYVIYFSSYQYFSSPLHKLVDINVKVIRVKKSQKTKGFGFVAFTSAADYIKAYKEMNGNVF